MEPTAWIGLATLAFLVLSTVAGIAARALAGLAREIRGEKVLNQLRHESNIQRLVRIETKLNIIGNGSVAHLPGGGPE